MFHEGDLQSGIALAIRHSKRVVCFVRDDSEESAQWENEWMCDDSLIDVLPNMAVLLRIDLDSQEAGFLSAFCPITSAPTLVVIHNGRLLETITPGTSHDEFISRALKAVEADTTETEHATEPIAAQEQHVSNTLAAQPSPTSSSNPSEASAAHTHSPSTSAAANAAPSPSSAAETLRAERNTRLEAESRHQAPADSPSNPPPASSRPTRSDYSNRQSYLEQQRQRKLEARQERERIMAQIEADKAERKARERERKQEAELARQAGIGSSSSIAQSPAHQPPTPSGSGTSAHLSVRLLDGATIRRAFPASAALDPDVRAWIASHSAELAGRPYTFKHILPPAPARTLSMSDERAQLRDLGFVPGAALVLVPLQQGAYVEAYGAAGGWGLLGTPRALAAGAYGLLASGVGAVSGALGWDAPQPEPPRTAAAAERPADGNVEGQSRLQQGNIRIRTLADQRAQGSRREQEFYNGNQTNFQSTDDDGNA